MTEAGTISRSVAMPRRIALLLSRIDLAGVTAASVGADLNGTAWSRRPTALLAATVAAALGVGLRPNACAAERRSRR
jgi:hypothetical protein